MTTKISWKPTKHGALPCLLLVVSTTAGCGPNPQTPAVQAQALELFEHFVVDEHPPGGADCCTDVLAAGDLNGDGWLDLVIGSENAAGAGLVWYEYPTWERHDISDGQFTTDGETVDFDVDGDEDVVIGDTSRGLVWVENLGGGNTWEAHTLLSDQYVHDLEVADLDRNGKLDVIIADKKAVHIIRRGESDTVAVSTPLVRAGEGLEVVDIDRDDDADILYSNMWLEQGQGPDGSAWTVHDIAPSWTTDTRTAAADINGDGRLDVVLSGSEGESPLAWFERSDGRGPWRRHSITEETLTGAHSLIVADLDDDGRLDVATAEMHTAPERRVLAFLQEAEDWRMVPLAHHGSHNMIAADFDQDGDPDVVGKNYAGAGRFVEYWANRSADLQSVPPSSAAEAAPDSWAYEAVTANRPQSDYHKFGLVIEDIDGDGLADVVAGGSAFLNPGSELPSGSWQTVPMTADGDVLHVLPGSENGWRRLLAADDDTLFVLSAASAAGSSWKSTAISSLPAGRTQGHAAGPADADGNYSFYFTRGNALLELAVRGGNERNWELTELRTDVEEADVSLADLDSDGDKDIVVVASSGRRLMLLEAEDERYSPSYTGASLYWIDRVETADLNADGRVDIVYTEENRDGTYNTHVGWLEAPTDPWRGRWQPHVIVVLRSANSLNVVDVDDDGDFDLIVAEHTDLRPGDDVRDNFTGVFVNDGKAAWSMRPIEIGPHSSHIGAKTGDLDGDGDLDVVSVGWEQSCCVHRWINPQY